MMSLSAIRQLSQESAERAAAEGLQPFVYWDAAEVDQFDQFPFPDLGDYRPDGWELVDQHFADASGLGAPDEPALTQRQLKDVIRRRIAETDGTVGWAIVEVGQFQLFVGEFRRS